MRLSLIVIIICLLFSCGFKREYFNQNVLFIGLEPSESSQGKVCDGQGWADLNMLMISDGKGSVNFVSFPRDTLVMVPGRGEWLINSIYFNTKNKGVKEWFSKEYGVRIDKLFVIGVDDIRVIIKEVAPFRAMNKRLQEILDNYEYSEDWVRSRHKLGVETRRQLRIQKFLDYMIDSSKFISLPSNIESKIATIVKTDCHYTDLSIDEITHLRRALAGAEIKYYLWSGEYKLVDFQYSWYKNKHYCYFLDFKTYDQLMQSEPTPNPYIYDRTSFFKKDERIKERSVLNEDKKVYRTCTSFK